MKILILVIFILLSGCSQRQPILYGIGDKVMVNDKLEGIVVAVWTSGNRYEVMFGNGAVVAFAPEYLKPTSG